MKRCTALCLVLVMMSLCFPVLAQESTLEVSGEFTSRFLSHEGVMEYRAEVKNVGSPTEIFLIFAKYADGQLQNLEVKNKVIESGNTQLSDTTGCFNAQTDKISAFVFTDLSTLHPLCRADAVLEAYESLLSDSRCKNLVTEQGTVPLTKNELDARFPIRQTVSSQHDQSVVNGVGMLALFEAGGPGEIYVKMERRNTDGRTRYKQFRTLRVINPEGTVTAYYDFSEKDWEREEMVLKIPNGSAGIWSISYTGGDKTQDILTFGIPECKAWGVRGEMTFKFAPDTLREWYVYVPEKSNGSCKIKASNEIDIYDQNNMEIQKNGSGYYTYEVTPEQTDTVWRVKNTRSLGDVNTAEILTFATGIPGLLCPSEAMARTLKGGTQTCDDGLVLGGSFQKRARDTMLLHKDEDLSVSLNFPIQIPEELTNYDVEVLLYGVYGCLSGLQQGIATQCLDSTSPYYGAFPDTSSAGNDLSISYENFNYGGRYSMSETLMLAAAARIPTKLNPAYGNRALITRSMLSSFCHFTALSPEFLIREVANSDTQFWPMVHVFFIYPSIAGAYALLKDRVDIKTAAVWRDGLILLGDKLANHIASQSNQWSEIIYGHLLTYRATGEERFLRYFERAAEAMTKANLDVDTRSLGQHSAGYYLEALAPGGSYQELSLHNTAAAYLLYANLAGANQTLIKQLAESLKRAVQYESLYWLPQTDGSIVSPTSMNLRAPTTMISHCGYPGMFLAAFAFPEANGLIQMLPYDENNYGYAITMPQVALNRPTLAKKALELGLQKKDTGSQMLSGHWTPRLYEAYALADRITEASLPPVYEQNKLWDLDGMLAWKKDGWYLLTHYDVPSLNGSLRSGFPAAVWSQESGAAILSMNAAEQGEMAHVYVAAKNAEGELYQTAFESGQRMWETAGKSYQILQPFNNVGNIRFTVSVVDEVLTIEVDLTNETATTFSEAYLNLPINATGAEISLESGSLMYRTSGGEICIECGDGAVLSEQNVATGTNVTVQNLTIPLDFDKKTVIRFTK